MADLLERHRDIIEGKLSCFDRVVIRGRLPEISHGKAMLGYLRRHDIPLEMFKDRFSKLRDEVVSHTKRIAAENGISIDWVRAKRSRKDDRVKGILAERGWEPGLVHIISAMESIKTFSVLTSNKGTPYLKARNGQCGHYYFYFIDPEFGLCYLRVPTWAPYHLQFYFNGHNWLAGKLEEEGIKFTLVENAFTYIADYQRAQEIVESISIDDLHEKLDHYTQMFLPVLRHFDTAVQWSIMQIEMSTDIIFKSEEALAPVYENLIRTAVLDVKSEHVGTFFGRKIDGNFRGEIDTQFSTTMKGTCIRHHMGLASIKMYDKFGRVLRIETTVNDVGFFKHRRMVHHRNGTRSMKVAPVRRTIHSIPAMSEIMVAANHRYLEFISALDDPSSGNRNLDKIGHSVRHNGRSNRGFNLFLSDDLKVLITVLRGEFNISGFRNKDLQQLLGRKVHQVSRIIKRLHLHGLIKKVAGTYKYYLTKLGKAALVCALHLREHLIIPTLALS